MRARRRGSIWISFPSGVSSSARGEQALADRRLERRRRERVGSGEGCHEPEEQGRIFRLQLSYALAARLCRRPELVLDRRVERRDEAQAPHPLAALLDVGREGRRRPIGLDRKSTRLNSSHLGISYAVFCLKKKKYA